ncbi:hypothetical protein [Pedobacter metabolipauper]|uniref:Uncharacterized protein n=1 Tax=Pedobacter metabolipauper TaxID=425513 RepID=A0A4R6SQB3_9SPHI|nr:hypothetical protein [Pedobacter metabolipauper]TDQ06941.1 hypothetical protein ATK78_3956 [Pedobacter metabolipauper]
MRQLFYVLLLLLLTTGSVFAQNADINNFMVKESLLKNSKMAIIATDSLDNPIEKINGIYTFTVSGFTQSIKFNDGVAVLPLQLERSAFVYIKHQNDKGTHSKLLYVYKKDGTLTPYVINSFWLILFPAIIIFLAFAFRKFIYAAVIILLIFIYFNHSSGLNLSTFFETIFDGLKKIF